MIFLNNSKCSIKISNMGHSTALQHNKTFSPHLKSPILSLQSILQCLVYFWGASVFYNSVKSNPTLFEATGNSWAAESCFRYVSHKEKGKTTSGNCSLYCSPQGKHSTLSNVLWLEIIADDDFNEEVYLINMEFF